MYMINIFLHVLNECSLLKVNNVKNQNQSTFLVQIYNTHVQVTGILFLS